MWSPRLRRLWLGLKTLFGSDAHGYFIPARSAGYRRPVSADPAYPFWEGRLKALEAEQGDWLKIVDGYGPALTAIDGSDPGSARWTQDWFPRLDAAMLYGVIRHCKPERIVEIGAGHSTRFALRAIADEGLETALTVIDPEPRKEVPKATRLNWIAEPLQRANPEIWAGLGAGDIVSIDSSHVLMPGSDVDLLLNVIMPSLPSGAMIQVHDIFLPDAYPAEWRWRSYNEQLALAPLLAGPAAEVMMSSHYVTTRMESVFRQTALAELPFPAGARESSFWFRIAERAEPASGRR